MHMTMENCFLTLMIVYDNNFVDLGTFIEV